MISREVALAVDVDVEALAQELDAGLGDLLAHEHLRASAHRANASRATVGGRAGLLGAAGGITAKSKDS